MIKLVVFDWNGTILSDTNAIVVGVNARLKFFDHPAITIKQYRDVFQMPAIKLYEALGIDTKQYDKAAEQNHSKLFHDAYEAKAIHARTRAGTREVLTFLEKVGISKILLSNHTVSSIKTQCKRLKLDSYFETVLANDDVWNAYLKGKKDRLVQYLADSKLKPSEVLIIGDSTEEIEIGKELGLHTVAISGGFVSTKRLKYANPDVLIHKLRDLIDVIKEIK